MGLNEEAQVQEYLHRVIVKNPEITVAELAKALGVRPNDLYEWGNINQPRRFPLPLLPELIKITGDTRIINILAAQSNLVVFKQKRLGKHVFGMLLEIISLQKAFNGLTAMLLEEVEKENKNNGLDIIQKLNSVISDLAGWRKHFLTKKTNRGDHEKKK